MSLSQYLNVNTSSLYNITRLTVCVFVMLQLAVWYPLLSDTQDDVDRYLKQKERAETEWRQIQEQGNKLKEAAFIDTDWVSHRITSEKNALPTLWSLEGSAGIFEWQTFFEQVEEHIALGLQSVYWKRQKNGQWRGRLLFDIETPKSNREYHNWLPTKLRGTPFVEKDWRILSTMRVDGNTSALLEHKKQRHWVRQGSWLPSVGLTVDTVSFDRVTLEAKDGSHIALTVREEGDADD